MNRAAVFLVCVGIAGAGSASQEPGPPKSATLLEGLGTIHHPVSTQNAEAQKFFDQGLRLIYAFNHDEAFRAFQRAAELDPKLAMAHWGMALAVGPNYNLDPPEAALKAAYVSIQQALALAKDAPAHEKAYIEALARRYSADPKSADKKSLARDYAQAMRSLSQRFPDDLDAATLFAESAMNLRPWQLWSKDGKPAEGTEEIVTTLQSVLRRNPDHTGANHYLIHALEASPHPEHALAAADRLRQLAPRAGHLLHMPSHIYILMGDYESAALANEKAVAVDHLYITRFNVKGIYGLRYFCHNLLFLAVAHAMQGRQGDAADAAAKLTAHVGNNLKEMPALASFLPTATLVQVRFQRWDEILAAAPPDDDQPIARTLWHYARGLALTAKANTQKAQLELAAMEKIHGGMAEDLKYGGRNLAKDVLLIPRLVLEAKIGLASKQNSEALALLEKASHIEDNLNYAEPPPWWLPVRETLGAALLSMNKPAEAEKVFRSDLERHRRNPRSLFGLMKSLLAQGQTYAAQCVEQEFRAAWKNADSPALPLEN